MIGRFGERGNQGVEGEWRNGGVEAEEVGGLYWCGSGVAGWFGFGWWFGIGGLVGCGVAGFTVSMECDSAFGGTGFPRRSSHWDV
jgi:hypothetical protein